MKWMFLDEFSFAGIFSTSIYVELDEVTVFWW